MKLLLLTVFSVFTAVCGLKCYEGHGGANETVVNPNECILGQACIKAMDNTINYYTKSCSTQNCSSPVAGSTYGPGGCIQSFTMVNGYNHNVTTCCCYGDLCNSEPSPFVLTTVFLSATIALLFL